MTVNELMKDAQHRMDGALDALDEDLAGFRTGRASPALVHHIQVDYFGSPTPLNQMATIAAPEPRLLTIRPWDPGAMAKIEKAIMSSDLGLMPSNDGQLIRLPIPILTEERREELTRLSAKRCEEARVAIRNVRRDLLHHLDSEDLSEDELYGAKQEAQDLTDKYVERIDALYERKVVEIREV